MPHQHTCYLSRDTCLVSCTPVLKVRWYVLQDPEMGADTDSPLPALWDMDSADYECDCPGPPPPQFHLPPPPRPPFLHEVADCSEAPLLELETCDTMPVSSLLLHNPETRGLEFMYPENCLREVRRWMLQVLPGIFPT